MARFCGIGNRREPDPSNKCVLMVAKYRLLIFIIIVILILMYMREKKDIRQAFEVEKEATAKRNETKQ